MAIVKTSVVLQSSDDIDALLVKRGAATLKTKEGNRGYDIDAVGGGLMLTAWDSALGATPTQVEVDGLKAPDRAAGVAAARLALLKRQSRSLDRLTDFGLIRSLVNGAAWNALTTPQKVAAVLGDADAWITLRQAIESNLP